MGTVNEKLRPQFRYTGERLHPAGSGKLLVISRPALLKDENYPDDMCYMTPFFAPESLARMWGPLDLAASWYEEERIVAEEAAAQFILSDPKRYFGKVTVEQVP